MSDIITYVVLIGIGAFVFGMLWDYLLFTIWHKKAHSIFNTYSIPQHLYKKDKVGSSVVKEYNLE